MKKKILITLGWLVVWQLLALLVGNKILLAGPAEVITALVRMAGEGQFWSSVLFTTGRILLGFFLGTALGILLAAAAYKRELLADILAPLLLVMKSVPVAAFVILLLIWIGSGNLSVAISFIVVFPIIYTNTLSGLRAADPKLTEMAFVFRIPKLSAVRYIYLPELYPYLSGAVSLALGMSWKAGIAAEVIGQPLGSVGNGLYRAKINLATEELFAWTFVAVLLSFAFEKLILYVIHRVGKALHLKEGENA